ncbi:hypothetical protein Q8F55_000936 [Vanrija albida]|uniref:RNase III domain-containing protein n=1 Tax=Vanrija albida TaxID=181172 RepID=A0ABR3QEP3_9TREE
MSSFDIPDHGLNTMVLPDLPSDLCLPPLPPIADAHLARLAVTHSSAHQLPRRPTSLEFEADEKVEDYEKLEHVGDSMLGSVVTGLLHDLFPLLRPGPATMLKSHLVSNATLRQLCVRYKITDHIIAAPVQLLTIKSQEKPVASIFEAYIAAVFYDYLTSEVPGGYSADNMDVDDDGASSVSTDEPSVTGATADDESVQGDGEVDISIDATSTAGSVVNGHSGEGIPASTANAQNLSLYEASLPSRLDVPKRSFSRLREVSGTASAPSGPPSTVDADAGSDVASSVGTEAPPILQPLRPLALRTRGGAFDYIDAWLRPLFTPIARWALDQMQADARVVVQEGEPSSDHATTGALSLLHSWATKETGRLPTYASLTDAGPPWAIECVAVDKSGVQVRADATRETKAAAKNVAAWKVARQLSLEVPE